MPGPPGAFTLEFDPFPYKLYGSSGGEGRPAFTLFESFAREETVLLVEAVPGWTKARAAEPPAVIFDVVAAYPADPDTANPSTSMGTVRVVHGSRRRFLIGVPGGHKLVLYPEEAGWTPDGSNAEGRIAVTIVDYWA